MECANLLKELDKKIIPMVNKDNCSRFFLDSIRFESKVIADKCKELIQKNIETILASEDGTNFLLGLPVNDLK